LQSLHLSSGEVQQWRVSSDLGGFALDGAGRALLALRGGLHWLDLATGAVQLITPSPFDSALIRFNEAAATAQAASGSAP
jgi:sugar lactone lactonase YvrE